MQLVLVMCTVTLQLSGSKLELHCKVGDPFIEKKLEFQSWQFLPTEFRVGTRVKFYQQLLLPAPRGLRSEKFGCTINKGGEKYRCIENREIY
jgi:hypothetical protein